MKICFFEDKQVESFYPLTLTRPMDDLRLGILTIREKWLRALDKTSYCRLLPKHLKGVFEQGNMTESDEVTWINSRFLPSQDLLSAINELKVGQRLVFKNVSVVAKVSHENSGKLFNENIFSEQGLEKIELDKAIHIEHLWDLLSLNSYEIEKDIQLMGLKAVSERTNYTLDSVHHPSNTFIGEDVMIEPGCIFIAKDGPVVIQDGATIEAGSILRGPVVVGEGATVKMAARIYGGTTIGPVCKVGGEVSGCIFHSYSNKAHDGFAGNSIFGQWVNLGANTITSNLKNDYKNIEVTDWTSKEQIQTGKQFLGTVMADHSKTAINTMLNTGTICGVSSNVFIDELSPKVIDSFTWLGPRGPAIYRFEKAIEVMQAMMKRRDVELTDDYERMMKHIFTSR
ncbi:putative sugar nucleotidyl transferase [Gracilimonas sp.]|uniref:putative sugar nucleotidyl transferase n=1 Tax=Gracilimonas sp. TaxID=1974203 RepID=UPI0032EB5365